MTQRSVIFLVVFLFLFPFVVCSDRYDCPVAPVVPGDRRIHHNTLKVASFNVYWLFWASNNTRSPFGADAALVEEHVQRVASVIRDMDADIVNLVEVEDCSMLIRVSEAVGEEYKYKPYMIFGTDTYTKQNVGILTRIDPSVNFTRSTDRMEYPLEGSFCGYSGPSTSQFTKHFLTSFRVPVVGNEVDDYIDILLLGLHFKAIPTDPRSCSQREAQAWIGAKFLREKWLEMGTHPEAMILGDYNDYSDEFFDSYGFHPLSFALRLLRNFLSSEGGEPLYNIVERVPSERRYSNWYDRNRNDVDDEGAERSLLDHFLVSRGLKDRIQSFRIVHSFDSDVLYSDHWPVVTTFDMTDHPRCDNVVDVVLSSSVGDVWPMVEVEMNSGESRMLRFSFDEEVQPTQCLLQIQPNVTTGLFFVRMKKNDPPTVYEYDVMDASPSCPKPIQFRLERNETVYVEIVNWYDGGVSMYVDAEHVVETCAMGGEDDKEDSFPLSYFFWGILCGVVVGISIFFVFVKSGKVPKFCLKQHEGGDYENVVEQQ